MRNSKHGLRALGLSFLAVLGLMAFFASAAQAGNGLFTVNLAHATNQAITGTIKTLGLLLVKDRNLQITCHTGKIVSANFLNSKEALGEVLFESCLVEKHGGGLIATCHIVGNGGNLHITSQFIALAVLHEDPVTKKIELLLLFEPHVANPLESGALFTKVVFKSGTGCALPLNNPVTGQVCALVEDSLGVSVLESDLPLLLFSEAIQLLCGDKLSYGTATAYIIGGATLVEPVNKHKIGVH